MAKKYRWNGGKRTHTISLGEHRANVSAARAGLNPAASLTAPLTTTGAYGQALGAANAEYGPSIRAGQQMQANLPAWYQNYMATSRAAAAAANGYAQPLLNTAQAGITNAATTAPGLDPSSPQYATDQQAAAGRASIAQLGYDTLAAVPAATNAGFAGQQAIAARDLPQQLAYFGQQVAGLQGDRNAKALANYSDIRANEQNAEIARETIGLNASNSAQDAAQRAFDNSLKLGIDPTTGEPLPADPLSPSDQKTAAELAYFDKHGYFPGTGKPASDTGPSASDKRQEQQRVEKIRAASGAFKSRIKGAAAMWDDYAKKPFKTGKPVMKDGKPVKDPVTGKPVPETRAPTPDELRAQLRSAGYNEDEIHIALLVRAGKTLDAAALKYMKSQNLRIPAEWRPGGSDRYGGVGKGADTTEQPSGGSSGGSGLTTAGKAPTATQVLANPQHYTAAQVKTAKKLKAQGGSMSIQIDAGGGAG